MSQDKDSLRLPAVWGWLAPIAMALGLGWLCWQAWWNPKIQFLAPGSAPWILYPSPPQTRGLVGMELPAEFHRQLVLAEKPTRAILDFRCFQRGQIFINGQPGIAETPPNWKHSSRVDVASQLYKGTNEITATIWAATGPPALSLRLQTDDATLFTDESWDVSLAGALRLPACRAGEIVESLPGNPLFDREQIAPALRRTLGREFFFLTIAALGIFSWRYVRSPKCALTILAIAWCVLLTHNFRYLTIPVGFDAVRHLDYVNYIQTHGSLPLANQGWEMYQAPLYYVISSMLLNVLHDAATSADGLTALRLLNLLAGAANVAFVWCGLRMIFPDAWKKQFAGAALAAFVPCQLYLLHYTTNEVLAAALGSASLWLCLKCVHTEKLSTPWCAGLGFSLGAACLTKASGIVLLPVIFAALAGALIARREYSPLAWLRSLGLVCVLALGISGWHYWRLWSQFGTPLAGNWSPGVSPPWWQRPGYLTPKYFLTFGRALTDPFFSGYHSFWDGLYSTCVGDALWGGGKNMIERPPWNYNLMSVGFLLALGPVFLIGSGAFVALCRFVRQPLVDWFLLIGVSGAFLCALALMALKLPFYGQAKAFYALPVLLPICAFAVAGFDFWTGRRRLVALIALTLSVIWIVNTYMAFWIRPNALQTRAFLSFEESYAGDEAAAPTLPATLQTAKDAAHGAPDDDAIALNWLNLARNSGRPDEIIAAGEWYLRDDPFNLEAHSAMADALSRFGQTNAAALHMSICHLK